MDIKKLIMSIDIVPEDIVQFLKEYLDFEGASTALAKLKKEFDINPFDSDEDEYKGVFEEVHHNMALIRDAAVAIVICIEKAVAGVVEDLDDPKKHSLAQSALDDMIRLPWYMEFVDGPVIDLILTFAVREAKRVDWGLPQSKVVDGMQIYTGGIPRSSAAAVMYGLGAAHVARKIESDGPESIKEKILQARCNLQSDSSNELDLLIKKKEPK